MDKKSGILMRGIILLILGVILIGSAQNALANPDTIIHVTTQADELNSDGDCSLREAIQAANQNIVVDGCSAGSGADIISIPSGTYTLTIAGAGEDSNLTGDLDILESVEIIGAGSELTIIDGHQIDRVFHISSGLVVVDVTIKEITVRNGKVNTAGQGGAGILVQGSKSLLDLQNSIITENQAKYPNGTNATVGGGLDNFLATLVVTDCTITNNSADRGGGIYTDGNTEIYQSAIYENNARDDGGGIDSGGSKSTTLENVTISNNTAPSGSGIFNDSTISFLNSTIVYNGPNAAGVANNGTAKFKNTLITYNGNFGDVNCSGGGTFTSFGHNLENANTCNFNTTGDHKNTIPLIDGNLQDNGGPTLTHALLHGSPAIDAGDNTGCPSADQRGVNRPIDADQDGTAVCDIGAYEAPIILYLPIIAK